VLLVPCESDLYFRVADNAGELPHLRAGDLRPIPSVWGHRAGSPAGLPTETEFLREVVNDWLDRPSLG
jgi:homoserine O-acetyltransferase